MEQQGLVANTGTAVMEQLANQHGIRLLSDTWAKPEVVSADFKGFFDNAMPDRAYHTDHSAVARGDILAILKSPAHVGARRQQPYVDATTEKNLRIGRAVHMLLLEPEAFKRNFVIQPKFTGFTKDGRESTQSGEAKRAKAEWYASLPPGAAVVTVEEVAMLFGMAQSIARNSTALALIEGSICENAVYYRDPVTGFKCRTKPDAINRGLSAIVEIKTTAAEGPKEFQKASWGYRYDIQLAMQAHGVQCVTGELPETLAIIAMEKEPPYSCMVFTLDVTLRDRGMRDYRRGLDLMAQHVQTNQWDGYPETEVLTVPKWALAE